MLENNDRFPLQEIIMEDLFTSNKLVLILLLAITVSALGTVWITPPNPRRFFSRPPSSLQTPAEQRRLHQYALRERTER